MSVDPQIQALLDKGTGVPATHTLSVAEAREQYEARISLMAPPAAVGDVSERTIDGPGGRDDFADLHSKLSRPVSDPRVLSRQRLCPVQPRYA